MKLLITICVSFVLINKLYSKKCCSQVIVSTGADKSKTLFEDIDGTYQYLEDYNDRPVYKHTDIHQYLFHDGHWKIDNDNIYINDGGAGRDGAAGYIGSSPTDELCPEDMTQWFEFYGDYNSNFQVKGCPCNTDVEIKTTGTSQETFSFSQIFSSYGSFSASSTVSGSSSVTSCSIDCRKSGSCSSFQYDHDSQTCSLGGEVNYDFVTQYEEGKQPIFTKIPGCWSPSP